MKTKGVYLVPTRLTVEYVLQQVENYPPQIAAKARAAAAAEKEVKRCAPAPGRTTVYVFRDSFVARLAGFDVLVDGRLVFSKQREGRWPAADEIET